MANLTSLTNVKAYLDITSTTYDSLLNTLITAISAQVENYCGRQFIYDVNTPTVQYFDTDGETEIFLRNYPIETAYLNTNNGVIVKYQTGTWDNITWTDYQESSYILNPEIGKVTFAGTLPKLTRYLQITYIGGYDDQVINLSTTLVPQDLIQTVTELVTLNFNNRKSQGISNMSTEGQSVTFSNVSIPKEYYNRLSRYINYK